MQSGASSSFSCCHGLRASWSVKEPSSSLPAQLPGPALGAGKMGSCLERQAGGGSETAAGRGQAMPWGAAAAATPWQASPDLYSLEHSPFPSFSPVTGALAACLQPCPCSVLLRASIATGTPVSCSPLQPQQGLSVAHGYPSLVPGFLLLDSASQKAFPDLCIEPRGHPPALH